ncbi:MAG: 2-succinyl-5-enolpyruvyl-6-hydroxy-3-cyclohexene-1-carboxylic-acid synthase [Flavobacteriales bacterium]|nr:2-succinyl-5-enolpyruvyl-6-hydroxy-3-cyclohexene-1-carboxylic-acid synthase [Flavobacteriales bacterium]
MIYPEIPLAQGVIDLLQHYEIKDIVISPGSRNAPLTIGFSENPNFNCFSIVDERSAAFFALGRAQQTGQPVALVCTSGSALLNYYPAVAEAFYSQIPLVILSADRPQDKIDIGDGQTIRQENVFQNHSLYNANLMEEWNKENNLKINEALHYSILNKGPVHINIPFEEPLYATVDVSTVSTEKIQFETLKTIVPQREWNQCIESWSEAQKKLILIGVNTPKTISQKVIELWANDPSVVVMTETTSNCTHEKFINCIDQLITPFDKVDFERFRPEILITFGGMVVSKRIKSFLRKYTPNEHWHIDELRAYDTYGCLSKHLKTTPDYFFNELYEYAEVVENSDYQTMVLNIKSIRKLNHYNYLKNNSFNDLKTFEIVLDSLPRNSQLQLSNSSTVRYAQLFDVDPSIEVFCNRGTSGIDGSTSTAVGAASTTQKQTIVITGDISFFYDTNALWNNYIPNTFKIIVINNAGGGIFRILPGHKETATFNTFFETQHSLNASHLAEMHGLDYQFADNEDELKNALESFYLIDSPAILEVFTPTTENDKVLLDYFQSLK